MTNYDILKEYEAHKTPVPSYEEWQVSYNCMLENEVLRLKNAQLKELLKEWVQFEIEENPNDFTVISERMSELANKTNSAIEEKEKNNARQV